MTWRLHCVADIEASGHVMSHDSFHVTRLLRTRHDLCTRNMYPSHTTWHVHIKRDLLKRDVTYMQNVGDIESTKKNAECGWHWGKWACHHLWRASAFWPLPGLVVCVAGCFRALQYAAVCCSMLSPTLLTYCQVLQCVAVFCSVWQCFAVWCSVLQCSAVCCSVLQCGAVWCSVVQCDTVLQCVTVCWSVRNLRFMTIAKSSIHTYTITYLDVHTHTNTCIYIQTTARSSLPNHHKILVLCDGFTRNHQN